VDRCRERHERLRLGDLVLRGTHETAEQSGDQDGVVDDRARVADPQLQGGRVGRRPDVEVGHLAVCDHTAVDQVVEQVVVLLGRLDPAGRAGAGPALPDDRPDARVAGVLSVPERGAGRQGQQDREVPSHPLHDLDGQVAVGDADVDLQPADQLLVHQQPVLLLHPAVAPGGGQLEVGEHRARCRPGGSDAETLRRRDLGQSAAEPYQLGPQLAQTGHHVGVGLDSCPLDLRGVVVTRQPGQHLRSASRQAPALEIDQVQLFLGTQRQLCAHP
jgi:hypothetical protein